MSPTPTPTPRTTPTPTTPKICFISGPLIADAAYLHTHYAPRLLHALSANHHFLLGPSRGIDTLALHYLLAQACDPARITVHLPARDAARYAWFAARGGRIVVSCADHTRRDEAMTRASHYDVLRYRPPAECVALFGARYRARVSGTEKNEIRRRSGVGLVWVEGVEEVEAAAAGGNGQVLEKGQVDQPGKLEVELEGLK
ncbi:hypothetical protein DFP73DRAFT_634343 [Morchella snyderi]|nr:hypothetical protein DFP73DRAFT_634343 [Morchella snyderi]